VTAQENMTGQAIGEEVHFSGLRMRCYTPRPRGVDQLLREAVARNAAGDAIVDQGVRLTYQEFDKIVDQIASNMVACGIKPGDRVAVAMRNRSEFVTVLMATIRIKAIFVPINVREQRPGFTYILNHSGAKALVYDQEAKDRLPQEDETPELLHRFSISETSETARPFEDLTAQTGSAPEFSRPNEEDTAVILYTSGTTGKPKGVILTHLNICHSVMHFENYMDLTKADRSLLAVPASHVTGLIANILTMIRCSGCNLILPQFSTDAFLNLAAAECMTHALMVPTMYNLCLLRADFNAYDLSNWRIGGFGGAPMPEVVIGALAEQLPDLILMNAYGSTETTSPATIMPMGRISESPDSVGKTVPCGDITIVDEDGCDVAPGEAGEIWIAGPMVSPGYWQDKEVTSASFFDGYWKSGDIGSVDNCGYVRLHDRKKDMIIRGGYNVYSVEVENTLNKHLAVIECAAVASPDPVLGEKIHVFVHALSATVSIKELQYFCAEYMADYKVPDFITFIDDPLPRNANGKILNNVLRGWASVE
jgi:long-chain acyl-CoA synthetase